MSAPKRPQPAKPLQTTTQNGAGKCVARDFSPKSVCRDTGIRSGEIETGKYGIAASAPPNTERHDKKRPG
ncbi:hypothetical protein [uncultured Alistipes sp.]|uniref:hypothetical protein n=1 Tax=uncultured Alistipes sp. TaxID=538949 RepID=UPI0025D6E384|nr:hypothetical protein [uncultured Alistipes sp.]